MNRRALILELILHTAFLVLMTFSCANKRYIDDAFRLSQALQTIFVDEAFGDYNEKSFLDAARRGQSILLRAPQLGTCASWG